MHLHHQAVQIGTNESWEVNRQLCDTSAPCPRSCSFGWRPWIGAQCRTNMLWSMVDLTLHGPWKSNLLANKTFKNYHTDSF